MENQYPGNSDRAQEHQQTNYTQKRVQGPVINGTATNKERTAWNAIEEFFGLGECRSFRDYVSALSDMTNRVYGAIDTLLGNRKYTNTTVPGARVAYQSYYPNPVQQSAQQQKPTLPASGQYYIVYDQREDAEIVLAKMMDLLILYKNVSIGDMYDLAGLTEPGQYNGMKYGWLEGGLNGVRVIPYGSKWVINLPAAIPLP